jgi:hypothetical protein
MWSMKRFKINRLIKKLKSFQQARIHNQPSEQALKVEIDGYYKLAAIYIGLHGSKKFPFAREMVQECYRKASELEDANAAYILGKDLLEEAKFRDDLQKNGVFAGPINGHAVVRLFGEAHAYLQVAEKHQHVEAKRLEGLSYINGWGVEADKKHGFDLIVASIEQENSWDRVPQIFAALGLNKTEFFSELAQYRNNKG